MLSFSIISAVISVFLATTFSLEPRYVEVDVLTREALLSQSSNIFKPQIESSDDNSKFQHHVIVHDKHGRFMKLEYSAEHPKNVEFFKIDLSPHSDSIVSIQCVNNNLNSSTYNNVITYDSQMIITFLNETITKDYFNYISSIANDKSVKSHYIAGSHLWICHNPYTNRYSPILREIVSVDNISTGFNGSSLIINTNCVNSYTDIFTNLNINFETNMKVYDPSFSHKSYDTDHSYNYNYNDDNNKDDDAHVDDYHSDYVQIKRRRLSWLGNIWNTIVDGIETFVDNVVELVEDIEEEVVETVEDYVISDIVNANGSLIEKNSYEETLLYNYSNRYLDSKQHIKCVSCYARLDLTFYYKLIIKDNSISYFSAGGIGNLTMEIIVSILTRWGYEWTATTPKIPIPYLSFWVAGIVFGFDVYGAFGVGIKIDVAFSNVGTIITGSMSRGIEYTKENGLNYISDESLDYDIVGPDLDYNSATLEIYIKPTVYLELDYIASVYLGIQPQMNFNLQLNSGKSDCVIDYTPTAKVSGFVGGKIDPFGFVLINASTSVTLTQVTLTSLEGCITQNVLSTYEIWAWDFVIGSDSIKDDHEFFHPTPKPTLEPTNNPTSIPTFGPTFNPTLNPTTQNNENEYSTFTIDYTNPDTLAYVDSRDVWGKNGNEWWGNLSCGLCNESIAVNFTLPDYGTLMLQVGNNGSNNLIGIYQTGFTNYQLLNGEILNFTCITRLNFSEIQSEAETYYNTPIFKYHTEIMEYYCNSNNSNITTQILANLSGDSFFQSISLDKHLSAISPGSHFRVIYMFDTDTYCHSFLLSKHYAYDLDNLNNSIYNDSNSFDNNNNNNINNSTSSSHMHLHHYTYNNENYTTAFATILATQGWFGKYHCNNCGLLSVTLFFQSYDPISGNISCYMSTDIEADNINDGITGSINNLPTQYNWLYGKMDWQTKVLCMSNEINDILDENDTRLYDFEFCGLITLLDNGGVWFTGNVTYQEHECSAVVIKGYSNVNDLGIYLYSTDDNNINDGNDDSDDDTSDTSDIDGDNGDSNCAGNTDSDENMTAVCYVLLGMGIMAILVGIVVVIAVKCFKYSAIRSIKRISDRDGLYTKMEQL